MTTYLLVLLMVFWGSTNAEDTMESPTLVTGTDGKPCNSGTLQGNQCSPATITTEKPSTMESTKKEDEIQATTKNPEVEHPTSSNNCEHFQHFLLKDCQYDCDSGVCSDMDQYNLNMCQNQGQNCTTICTVIVQKHEVHCTSSSTGTPSDLSQRTTSPVTHPFIVSTNPPSPATGLPPLTIIIAIVAAVVVLIISVLILIVLILFLVFRHKTKLIQHQQRHEDPQAMERYVTKEFESFSEANKDPLYDTIDETIFNMSTNPTNKVATTTRGMAAASSSITVPTAVPRLPDRSHSEATGDVQVNEVPLMYEEPVSSLRNSVSHIGNVARLNDQYTGTTTQAAAMPQVEAQYSLLEECTTIADTTGDPQVDNILSSHDKNHENPEKSAASTNSFDATGHVYATLEPPSYADTTLEEMT